MAELEAQLGARLVHRTSRRFSLTQAGREFYDHARAAVIESEAAEDVVRRRTAEPVGAVRITASVPTAQFRLAPRLPALLRAFPNIDAHVHVSDRFVDLVHEGFDIALRSHASPLPDSSLVQRRMMVERIVLVAAPDYVERRGTPCAPQDLAEHDGVHGTLTGEKWRLRNRTGEEVLVAPSGRLLVDEAGMLLQAAKEGLGIVAIAGKDGGGERRTAETRTRSAGMVRRLHNDVDPHPPPARTAAGDPRRRRLPCLA